MQEEWTFDQIAEGMDVCDVNGEKLGMVARAHRPGTGAAGVTTAREGVVEVKGGFFGLGSHYHVPASGIQNVGDGCVVLNRAKDALADWRRKPAYQSP